MLNFAFLGCGHIAKSLIQGFQKNTDIKIFGYDILEQNKEWLGKNNHSSCSLEECIAKSDIIFLCVKPQDLKTLCDEIMEFNIPTGVPIEYNLDDSFKPLSRRFLGS